MATPPRSTSLGPFQRIANVAWSAGENIIALKFDFSMSTKGYPTFMVSELEVGEDRSLFTGNFNISDIAHQDPVPPVVNPVSKEMRAHYFVWQFTTEKIGPTVEFTCSGAALLFFNVNKLLGEAVRKEPNKDIKSLVLCKIRTPPGGIETMTTPVYWLWDSTFGATSLEQNLEHPFSTGDPIGGGIMVVPRAFGTSTSRDQYLAIGVATFNGANRTETLQVNNNLVFTTLVRSYTKKLNFNESGANDITIVNSDLEVTGEEKQLDSKEAGGNQNFQPFFPAKTITYTLTIKGLGLSIDVANAT